MTNKTTTEAEATLATLEATSAEWRSAAGKIDTQIATAKATIAELEKLRRDHALDAALGRPEATTAISGAYEEQALAEKQLSDFEYAFTEAQARLQQASIAEGAARRAVNLEAARRIIDRRIAVAEKFDLAASQLRATISEYEDLWHELIGFGDLHTGVGVSAMEARQGLNRVKALLSDLGSGSLASSERSIFSGV